mmetsp:Transcript_6648/g.25664  ORF Transcript_6648/g.25664 Transcript_6648/m.25664 type:complete len:201 (+) Transcript_6648:727-1329(+)
MYPSWKAPSGADLNGFSSVGSGPWICPIDPTVSCIVGCSIVIPPTTAGRSGFCGSCRWTSSLSWRTPSPQFMPSLDVARVTFRKSSPVLPSCTPVPFSASVGKADCCDPGRCRGTGSVAELEAGLGAGPGGTAVLRRSSGFIIDTTPSGPLTGDRNGFGMWGIALFGRGLYAPVGAPCGGRCPMFNPSGIIRPPGSGTLP